MINRDIFRDQFTIRNVQRGDRSEFDRDRFIELIDKWKNYFHNHVGVSKGDIAAIGVVNNGVATHAIVFALAELGIQIVVAHLHFHKDIDTDSVIPLIKPDLCIQDNMSRDMCDGINQDAFIREVESYGNTCPIINIDEINIDDYEMGELPKDFAGPNDPLYISYDNGLEDDTFRFQYYTHKEVASYAARNGSVFNLKESLAVHTFNLIHADSLMTYMIPAYLYSTEHVVLNFWDRVSTWNTIFTNFVVGIMNQPFEKKVMIKNEETLENLVVRMSKEGRKSTFFIYPYGEYTETLHGIVQKYDIRVAVLTGEARARCFTLFTKVIDKNTVFEKGNVGLVLDTFYTTLYNAKEKVVLVRARTGREYIQLSHYYTKNDNGEYIQGERVNKSVHSNKVSEILGHNNFDILTKYGRHYLVVYEDFSDKEYDKLSDLNQFNDIVHQSRKAFCLENSRCRYWFTLKSQLEYGFDDYEIERLRYQNEEEDRQH